MPGKLLWGPPHRGGRLDHPTAAAVWTTACGPPLLLGQEGSFAAGALAEAAGYGLRLLGPPHR
ncbi:MAG: hypothetical protein ACLFS1_11005, partial [Opitutales bacterium]